MSGKELAKEIKKNHLYITGSLNEPSGNHHIEAAQCGLPILYKKSGGIPEYCNGYGLEYDSENLESKISELIANHSSYLLKMKDYQFRNEDMFSKYENLQHKCIISGDSKFQNIAAASILAKTYRDELMTKLGKNYPQYNWNKNKGYPTKFHKMSIKLYGLSIYHRKSFRLFDIQTELKF